MPSEKPEDCVEKAIIQKLTLESVFEHADRLVQDGARILRLRFMCDMNSRQIAEQLGVSHNVLMVHRVNADFMMRYKTVYPKLVIEPDVSTVIEVMKNRDLGIVDEIIKLYFDRRSRTMSDVKGLPPQHAWTEKIEQMTMPGFTEVDDPDLPEEWR